jgi:DNA-binding GntR family transcriptional regulator
MSAKSQSVLSRLYEDVVVGTFSFGTKLGEEQLVERYKTKRHILREAFVQLEEFGFVERVPNRGVFVREPHPDEVRELFELRELLEIQAASIMELPAPQAITDKMRDIQVRHSAATHSAQYREVVHVNNEFHHVQYSVCGNKTLRAAIQDYATRTHLITAMKFGEARVMDEVIAQHEAIIAAMCGSDHNALADAIRSHFDMARIEQYRQQYNLRHGDVENIEIEVEPP